jgi:hypothetical protein
MFMVAIQVFFILSLLVGAASLGRISNAFGEIGVLGEVRFLVPLGLTVVAFLLQSMRSGRAGVAPRTRALLAGVLLLHAFVALSWFWSDRVAFGGTQLYELAILALVLVLAIVFFRGDPRGGVRLLVLTSYWVAVAFVLASLLSSGSLGGDLAIVGAGGIGGARLLGAGVLAAAYLTLRTGRVGWLLPTPPMVAGILLSGSRAALLALFLGLAFLWWVRKSLRPVVVTRVTRINRWLRYAGIASVVVVFFWSSMGIAILTDFIASNLTPQVGSEGPALYLADRDVIFADAWSRFLAQPLGGLGIGSYLGPWGEFYPHNLLLSLAVDGGVFALSGGVLLLGAGFLLAVRVRVAEARFAVAAALFFLCASLFAGAYYDARFVWVFLLLASMINGEQGSGAASRNGSLGTLRVLLAGGDTRETFRPASAS